MKIVSACLAGVHCRYDGEAKTDPRVVEMVASGTAIPICPEQMGGMSTPRHPANVASTDPIRLVDTSGSDVTEPYRRGALEAVRLARLVGATEAILKEGSPSCGSSRVTMLLEGGATERRPGEGMTTAHLRAEGITVYGEENWPHSTNPMEYEAQQ